MVIRQQVLFFSHSGPMEAVPFPPAFFAVGLVQAQRYFKALRDFLHQVPSPPPSENMKDLYRLALADDTGLFLCLLSEQPRLTLLYLLR